MRSYTKDEKKSHILRFWIVTLLCAGMIGAASYFAYTQTANELTVQLEANVSSLSEMPPTEPPAPQAGRPCQAQHDARNIDNRRKIHDCHCGRRQTGNGSGDGNCRSFARNDRSGRVLQADRG